MKIWVDADACPVVIKEILFRAAERKMVPLMLVANQVITVPRSRYISSLKVGAGFDVADNEIVKRVEAGDLVITSDIPLAAEVIEKGALALSGRGELFTAENIRARLNVRDF
ncbi:MAG: YaiI/YqxD family protein, partial [Gammaproteobacteria bacterium]